MRVFLVLIFLAILSFTAFADLDHASIFNGHRANVIRIAEPEAKSATFFPKKKKLKSSKKVKKHNRSMGKKMRRKNDDTLRR